MKSKFQFLFVYDDGTESKELEDKKVTAIRISEKCCVSTEFFGAEGYTAYDAFEFACNHAMELLTPDEAEIIQKRLSGVRMMFKKSYSTIRIDHKCNIWTSDDGDCNLNNMEAISLSDGKTKFMGCQETETAGFLLKLPRE